MDGGPSSGDRCSQRNEDIHLGRGDLRRTRHLQGTSYGLVQARYLVERPPLELDERGVWWESFLDPL